MSTEVKEKLDDLSIQDQENYKGPAQKSLAEIVNQDAGDESLVKYKQALLGDMNDLAYDKSDPRKVIVVQIEIHSDELPTPKIIEMAGKTDKTFSVKIKEGSKYCVKVKYHVQHEIVSGLRYRQKVSRKGLPIDNDTVMIGSYAPRKDHYLYTSDDEEAPSGMLFRGTYDVKSAFLDDDSVVHTQFSWKIEIAKNW